MNKYLFPWIGYKWQTQVRLPARPSLVNQWVHWAYLQKHGEELLQECEWSQYHHPVTEKSHSSTDGDSHSWTDGVPPSENLPHFINSSTSRDPETMCLRGRVAYSWQGYLRWGADDLPLPFLLREKSSRPSLQGRKGRTLPPPPNFSPPLCYLVNSCNYTESH